MFKIVKRGRIKKISIINRKDSGGEKHDYESEKEE